MNRKFLGDDGAEAFRDWIRKAVAENKPYDKFAYEILTAQRLERREPAGRVLQDPPRRPTR